MRLLHHWWDEIVTRRSGMCECDVARSPFAGAPIEDLPLPHQICHRSNRFHNWRIEVGAVAEIEIQIVHLQAFERLMAGLDHMLAKQSFTSGLIASPKYLTRNTPTIAPPTFGFEDTSHHQF